MYFYSTIVISELRNSLIMLEMGTSRDPEKLEVILQNIRILTERAHGLVIFTSYIFAHRYF